MLPPAPPPTTEPRAASGGLRRVAWFIAVGTLAAGVHWAVAMGAFMGLGWPPLGANVLGWLVALGVSFSGHHLRTFAGHGSGISQALPRFALVSALSFVLNEALYAGLLEVWPGHEGLALALVLLAVAVITFVLSRRWAFAGRTPPASR